MTDAVSTPCSSTQAKARPLASIGSTQLPSCPCVTNIRNAASPGVVVTLTSASGAVASSAVKDTNDVRLPPKILFDRL